MKRILKLYGVVVVSLVLVFLFNRCGAAEESGDAAVKAKPAKEAQDKAVKPEPKAKKVKPILPKRVLKLKLTDEQRVACEAAYKEIFSPELRKKRTEMNKKLKTMEKGSEEHKKLRTEISDTFRDYNKQFRQKLKEILTKEQKAIYFKKAKKEKKTPETKEN